MELLSSKAAEDAAQLLRVRGHLVSHVSVTLVVTHCNRPPRWGISTGAAPPKTDPQSALEPSVAGVILA